MYKDRCMNREILKEAHDMNIMLIKLKPILIFKICFHLYLYYHAAHSFLWVRATIPHRPPQLLLHRYLIGARVDVWFSFSSI